MMQTVTVAHLGGGRMRQPPRHRHGLAAPLYEQARVLAAHLGKTSVGRYTGSQTATRLKVTGIDLFSMRRLHGRRRQRKQILLSDPVDGVYRKLKLLRGAAWSAPACTATPGRLVFDLIREGATLPGELREQCHVRPNQRGRRAGLRPHPETRHRTQDRLPAMMQTVPPVPTAASAAAA